MSYEKNRRFQMAHMLGEQAEILMQDAAMMLQLYGPLLGEAVVRRWVNRWVDFALELIDGAERIAIAA